MKTTIDIPDDALNQLLESTGAKTKKDAILQAVDFYNKSKKLKKLANQLGSFDGFMNSEELDAMRRDSV